MTRSRGLSLVAALKWRSVQAGEAVLRVVPAVSLRAAPLLGDLARLANSGARRRVRANLRGLLPGASPEQISANERGVFRTLARYYVELMLLPALTSRQVERRAVVSGYEWIPRLIAQGNGLIIVGVHVGPSELILQAFAARGVYYTAMVERLQPPQLDTLLLGVRGSFGQRYVFPDLTGAKELIRVLRAGGVVAMLIDRDVLGNGVPVSFLGHEIRAPSGAVELAAITGAPLLPAQVVYGRRDRLDVTIHPPRRVDRRARRGEALRAEVEALLAVYTPLFRNHADQWIVLERFWRD